MKKPRPPACPSCGGKTDKILLSPDSALVGQLHCRACGYVFAEGDPGPHPTPKQVRAFKEATPR